ncbi:protein ILRUN [Anastrepha ludens]|uniref:protein ILRUN n=1 Tax=Anastrepha ludens TaxID=28586 RepID=UPI0023B1ACB4|nr:protein ILRUN [Anastrepha ludens]XP_053950043.1 protein ILRUN [Anastrepha ludens]
MDISESFEQQQQQSENLQQQHQQLQMQCEPAFQPQNIGPTTTPLAVPFTLPATNGFDPTTINPSSSPPFVSSGQAIPLPAPPQMKSPLMVQPPPQPQGLEQQHRPRNDIDIDSLLLQQFSCLGTTDHEDLVKQFQSLMNNQVDQDAAKFYLEMSNWNLQTAVGCYLDIHTFQTLPSMKIVRQSRPSEHQQAFRLQNDGTIDWPIGCYLTAPSQKQRIEVPALKPGETCDILADIPPNQPALMWRLCTPNGWNVGEPIWMVPPGMTDTQAELSDRMSQLLMSVDSSNSDSCPQVNVVISVNME